MAAKDGQRGSRIFAGLGALALIVLGLLLEHTTVKELIETLKLLPAAVTKVNGFWQLAGLAGFFIGLIGLVVVILDRERRLLGAVVATIGLLGLIGFAGQVRQELVDQREQYAEIVSFTADPAIKHWDEPATLSWKTRNTRECWIENAGSKGKVQVDGSGSTKVHNRVPLSYTLTCTGPVPHPVEDPMWGGEQLLTKTIDVDVRPPGPRIYCCDEQGNHLQDVTASDAEVGDPCWSLQGQGWRTCL